MKDRIEKLHGFLTLNDREILLHAGKISDELALQKAETEYAQFDKNRIKANDTTEGDFEKAAKQISSNKKK